MPTYNPSAKTEPRDNHLGDTNGKRAQEAKIIWKIRIRAIHDAVAQSRKPCSRLISKTKDWQRCSASIDQCLQLSLLKDKRIERKLEPNAF